MKITEVTQGAIRIESLPTLMLGLNPNRAQRLSAAVDTLNSALAQGSIYNVVFNDVKGVFDYCLRDAAEFLSDAIRNRADGEAAMKPIWESPADIAWMHLSLHQVPTQIKRLTALQKAHPVETPAGKAIELYLRLNNEALPIANAMASLKAKIIKGRQPNPNAKPVFQPKTSTKAVIDQINASLTEQIAATIEKFKKDTSESFKNNVSEFLKAATATVSGGKPIPLWSVFFRYGNKVFEWEIDRSRDLPYKERQWMKAHEVPRAFTRISLQPGWEKVIDESVEQQANAIREHFINKNAAKLGQIVELKGNFKSAKTVHAHTRQGMIEGEMYIDFTDGSHFNVRNKVVLKVAPSSGDLFAQYPTTFHDVIMPDGKPMGMPSEERMNKVFAVPAQASS